MIIFPNAKINIGLNIVEKRTDGFHNLETLMYPLLIRDQLEIKKTLGFSHGKVNFSTSGIPIDGDLQNNLVCKAYNLLHADFNLPSVDIHLHKTIPIGGGLGGGSSDAAFALKGISNLFGLMLSYEDLENYAAQLGSDCAFFVKNKPAYATSRGEVLELMPVELRDYYIALVVPTIHISTKEAYSKVTPSKPTISLKEQLQQPITEWQNTIKNDFEKSVFAQKPAIAEVKEKLIKAGAVYASMSGSGASVFGIFTDKPNVDNLFNEDYFCRSMRIEV